MISSAQLHKFMDHEAASAVMRHPHNFNTNFLSKNSLNDMWFIIETT